MAVSAAQTPRQLLVFVAVARAGLVILAVTQVLSETRLSFGPWALGGNGSLAVPFVGFPLAIYGGWTALADRAEGCALATAIAPRAVTAVLIVFGLPALLAGQARAS